MDSMIAMGKRFSESIEQHKKENYIAHKIVNLLSREEVKVKDIASILTNAEAIAKRQMCKCIDNELNKIVCPTEETTSKV
jgi:hypothetical protein